MDIVFYLAAGVGGLFLGYIIGLVQLKQNKGTWEQQLAGARDKLAALKKDAQGKIQQAQQQVTEAEQKAASANEKVAQMSKALQQAQDEGQQATAAAQECEAARAQVLELADAHKKARQQAEGRCKQAETLAAQNQQAAQQLQHELESARAEATRLAETGQRQSQELSRLRAQLAGAQPESEAGLGSMELFADAGSSLEGVLTTLMEHEGQRTAVLADANGIVVAAVGEADLKEGMAATTQLVGSLTKQLEGMVPFSELRAFHLADTGSNVLCGRAFPCAGERVGLATYGPRLPAARVLDAAQSSVAAILE